MTEKTQEMWGITFAGAITVNGPMFDIHDNEHVHIHANGQDKENVEDLEQIPSIETSDSSNNNSGGDEGIQKELPQICLDAVEKVLKPQFTGNNGSILNSRVQLRKAVEEVDMGKNAQIGVLLTICKEVGVVKPNTGNTDFVRILIGLGFISYENDKQIKRIAHGFTEKIKKLPSKHTQWSGDDRTLGDKLYDTLRQG